MQYLERQPFAKVPAFERDGFELYEVSTINRYIDNVFDGPHFSPKIHSNVRARIKSSALSAATPSPSK
ncbi:MAG: glutathione S-transferase [Chitinophagales bacterium]